MKLFIVNNLLEVVNTKEWVESKEAYKLLDYPTKINMFGLKTNEYILTGEELNEKIENIKSAYLIDEEIKETQRGFKYQNFSDANGENCSIQNSSAWGNEENGNFIWLGISDPKVMHLQKGIGWSEYKIHIPETHLLINGRMHLSQMGVAKLLPLLHNFVVTGSIGDNSYKNNSQFLGITEDEVRLKIKVNWCDVEYTDDDLDSMITAYFVMYPEFSERPFLVTMDMVEEFASMFWDETEHSEEYKKRLPNFEKWMES